MADSGDNEKNEKIKNLSSIGHPVRKHRVANAKTIFF